jgi:glycine oxidase
MDCIIIGAGIMGLLTARELASAGLKVCVLDQSAVGRESSWAGGGILSPLYPWRYAEPVQRLAQWSQQVYPELVNTLYSDTGIDPERRESGLLILDNNEIAAAQQWAQAYPMRLEILDNKQLRSLALSLSKDLSANIEQALWFPDIGQVRNPSMLQSLTKDLMQRGVEIREQTQVKSLIIKKGKITGVQTTAGVIEAERVVACSGAWTRELLQTTEAKVEVQPVKGQMLMYKAKPELLTQIILHQDRYVIPRRDGRILVGSTLEFTGFDKSTSQQANKDIQIAAKNLIPELANYPVEQHWAGLRPGTSEGIPYIYADEKVAGLFVNCGHYRNGVVLGPASARLTADLVLQRQPIIDSQFFLAG